MDSSAHPAAFLRHKGAGKRRAGPAKQAARLDKTTSVADGEQGGKSPMMRALKAACSSA